jgi:hypothetical protein
MKLKILQLNSIFNYTKDIRRYTYDIEESLKLYITEPIQILPTPPVPDEIEPELPRFSCRINYADYNIIIEISQIRLVVIMEYNDCDISRIESELELFQDKISNIKMTISNKVNSFNTLYEGIIVISENIHKDISNIHILDVTKDFDEKREKETKLFNDNYFVTTEKIFLQAYQPSNTIPSLNKNKSSMFAGYVETYIREINNRASYNNQDDSSNNILDINNIKEKLLEELI